MAKKLGIRSKYRTGGAFSKVTAKNNPLMLLASSKKAEKLLKTLILIIKNRAGLILPQ
jgi:hypothetical protein